MLIEKENYDSSGMKSFLHLLLQMPTNNCLFIGCKIKKKKSELDDSLSSNQQLQERTWPSERGWVG